MLKRHSSDKLRLVQIAAETGRARLPIDGSLKDGTTRRLVAADRSEPAWSTNITLTSGHLTVFFRDGVTVNKWKRLLYMGYSDILSVVVAVALLYSQLSCNSLTSWRHINYACPLLLNCISRDLKGATENARPDLARPSKLWGLTSQDWTTRHHIARVDIVRLVSVFE